MQLCERTINNTHDPTQPRATKWTKVFAWRPRKLTNGQTVWLKFVYVRHIIIDWMPPAFPAKKYRKTQYASLNDVLNSIFTKKSGKKG